MKNSAFWIIKKHYTNIKDCLETGKYLKSALWDIKYYANIKDCSEKKNTGKLYVTFVMVLVSHFVRKAEFL